MLRMLLVAGLAVGAGVAWRRWLLPGLRGPLQLAVDATVAGIVTVVAGQLLGLAAAFSFPALCLALAVAWAMAALARRRWPLDPVVDTAPAETTPRWGRVAVAAIAGVTLVQWLVAMLPTIRHGIADLDALSYHLPHAAGYAQTGRLLAPVVATTGHPATWYPSNDEVLRAVGLLATGTELVSLALNVAAGAVVVLASYAVGRRWGRGWCGAGGALVLLAGPLYGARYGGWAHVDWTAVAAIAVGAAVATSFRGHRGARVIAGAALGMAIGTKLPAVPAAVAVAAVIVWTAHDRWPAATTIGAAGVLTGGWWYVRNLILLGTPMPGTPGFGGPPALASANQQTVLSYAGDLGVVREWYLPGLQLFFGWGWPLLLAVIAAAIWRAVRRGDPLARGFAAVALLATAAYLVLPTGAVGPPGVPVLFTANLRYLWPAALVATWVVAAVLPARLVLVTWLLVAVAGLVPARAWADTGVQWRILAVVVALAAAAAVVTGLTWRAWRRTGLAFAVVLVLGLAGLTGRYQAHRYQDPPATPFPAYAELFRPALGTRNVTVAVSGYPLSYPFTGPQAANRVFTPGRMRADGIIVAHTSCRTWVADLADRHADIVAVLVDPAAETPTELAWAQRLRDPRVLARNARGIVMELTTRPRPTDCDHS